MEGRTEETYRGTIPAAAETTDDQRERSRELEKRGLWYHVVLFIGAIMLLVAVNIILTPGLFWVIPVAILWGFFLMWHAWQVFGKENG